MLPLFFSPVFLSLCGCVLHPSPLCVSLCVYVLLLLFSIKVVGGGRGPSGQEWSLRKRARRRRHKGRVEKRRRTGDEEEQEEKKEEEEKDGEEEEAEGVEG